MTFEHSSSSLGRQRQMASAENNTSGPVPQCTKTFDRSRSSLGRCSCQRRLNTAVQASVFMSMMSDHNSSNLAPQRQEMSVENVSSCLVPQGQKASD
ncbi:hypothetical protein Tco_0447043, partial [Tanacetum coccineum]